MKNKRVKNKKNPLHLKKIISKYEYPVWEWSTTYGNIGKLT